MVHYSEDYTVIIILFLQICFQERDIIKCWFNFLNNSLLSDHSNAVSLSKFLLVLKAKLSTHGNKLSLLLKTKYIPEHSTVE